MVLDLAGTTIEDPGVAAAFRSAFASCGIEISASQIDEVRGRSKYDAVVDLLLAAHRSAELAGEIYIALRNAVRDRWRGGPAVPIAGAEDAMRSLRQRGIRVALNTGLDRETAAMLVVKLRWNTIIDALICADDVPAGRPAPFMIFRAMEATRTHAVGDVAVVGDTTADLEAGANAGVRWNIGVLTGAHRREQLARSPHTVIVRSVGDVSGYFTK